MELLGSILVAIILFVVSIIPVGAFASSLANCIMKCADED